MTTEINISDGAVLNVKQTAEVLEVHRNTVRNLCKKGLLKPHFHKNMHIYFIGKELKEYFYRSFL